VSTPGSLGLQDKINLLRALLNGHQMDDDDYLRLLRGLIKALYELQFYRRDHGRKTN
jgi:hypothetical protein